MIWESNTGVKKYLEVLCFPGASFLIYHRSQVVNQWSRNAKFLCRFILFAMLHHPALILPKLARPSFAKPSASVVPDLQRTSRIYCYSFSFSGVAASKIALLHPERIWEAGRCVYGLPSFFLYSPLFPGR